MKSLILRKHEVIYLSETGSVTVVRAVNQKKLQKDRLKLNMQIFEIYQAPEKVCPFGQPGEVRWVRETWVWGIHGADCLYKADKQDEIFKFTGKWRSSSTMPQWASRYNVECTVVKVEQIEGIWSWIVSYKKVGR
jgi:hypothetical protein